MTEDHRDSIICASAPDGHGRTMREPVLSQLRLRARQFRSRLDPLARRVLRLAPAYNFACSSYIQRQMIQFCYQGINLEVEADATTPLYDTIFEIVDYDCYQLSKMAPHPQDKAIVIDIGANVGIFSLLAARMYSGTVVAYEPLVENCHMLQKNLRRNSVANVRVVRQAVVGDDGPVRFVASDRLSVGGRVVKDNATRIPGEESEVPGIGIASVLSSYLKDRIDLIKVDCEGGEYEIISKITPTLGERIRAWTFEVHDLDSSRNLRHMRHDLERRLGYRTFYCPDAFGRSNLHHLLAIH